MAWKWNPLSCKGNIISRIKENKLYDTRGLRPLFASFVNPPRSLRFGCANLLHTPAVPRPDGDPGWWIGMVPRQRHLWLDRWLRLLPARRLFQWSQKVGVGNPHHGSLANCGENKSFAVTTTFLYYGEITYKNGHKPNFNKCYTINQSIL